MGITYDEAVKAQTKIQDKLFEDPNVVSVGVVEEIDDHGIKTGNFVIEVGVESTQQYQNDLKHGQSVIPSEYVLYTENNQKEEKHIRVNVVKMGKIEIHSSKVDFPTADDNIPASIQSVGDYTMRRRPSPCGQSIGHPNVSAGTIGLLLQYKEGPNTGKAYILSNNHVLAASNSAYVNDPIIQPGIYDSGVPGKDTIASLHRWVPIDTKGNNIVDAATAEVLNGKDWNKFVTSHIAHIGDPEEITDAQIGMNVEKIGRTTGHTQGQVISVNEAVRINYGSLGKVLFTSQIRTTSMSQGGDSGSCLLEKGTKKPVGLLFAGSGNATFHNPIRQVLSMLSNAHNNIYPGGKKHIFNSDYPLTILKRKFTKLPINLASTTLNPTMNLFPKILNLQKKKLSFITTISVFATRKLHNNSKSLNLEKNTAILSKKLY